MIPFDHPERAAFEAWASLSDLSLEMIRSGPKAGHYKRNEIQGAAAEWAWDAWLARSSSNGPEAHE